MTDTVPATATLADYSQSLVAGSTAVLAVIAAIGLDGALAAGSPTRVAAVFVGSVMATVLLALTIVGVIACTAGAATERRRLWLAAFAGSLSLAVSAAELRAAYPVGSAHDFRAEVETNHLKNYNLTESLLTAQNLLRGKGNTLPVAGGSTEIDTYRMPGYAVLVAASGALFRVAPDDIVRLAISTVYVQAWLVAGAVAFFAYQLAGSLGLGVSAVIAAATCWLPESFDLTQSDAVILPLGLFIAGALCRFHRESDPANVPLPAHLLLHGTFGLYFLTRSDILPGWAGVSLFLYWGRLRYLLLPLTFVLALGSAWGAYKQSHGSAFVMTTSNVGHVAFVGLWQNPSNAFKWQASDDSFVEWVTAHGYRYTDPRTDRFAIREVIRFWLTYPGYVIGNIWYKAYSSLRYHAWSGSLALYPSRLAGYAMRRFVAWWCAAAFVIALAMRVDRRRLFLVGWPILLNLPLFWLLQLNGRYLTFDHASLMFVGALLLVNEEFYRRVGSLQRHAVVWGIVTLVWVSAPAIGDALFLDGFRYGTPFLDPARSTLSVRTT